MSIYNPLTILLVYIYTYDTECVNVYVVTKGCILASSHPEAYNRLIHCDFLIICILNMNYLFN